MRNYTEERNENGFTLIELLIAIVVVGILTAVAIVGIAGLTSGGKKASCLVSVDAAKAASAVYYSNNKVFATTIQQLIDEKDLEKPTSVTVNGAVMNAGADWSVTMTGGGATENAFENTGTPGSVACS